MKGKFVMGILALAANVAFAQASAHWDEVWFNYRTGETEVLAGPPPEGWIDDYVKPHPGARAFFETCRKTQQRSYVWCARTANDLADRIEERSVPTPPSADPSEDQFIRI